MRGSAGAGRPRVVVCGAGFGGLWAARALAKEPVDVLLLDRNNYHTFYPLLYQVAAAELGPTDIAYPVRSILRKSPNVSFRMAEVTGLDLRARTLVAGGERIGYDHLVLSLGSVPADFGVDGVAEHAFFLREMDQAIPLRHHILSRFEAAAHETDPERRRRMLTFVIVGSGPTGVEYAGALAELIHGPLLKDYRMLDRDEVRVVLLEALDRLLPGTDDKMASYTGERLERRRVTVRLGARATRVAADAIHLDGDDPIPTETVVWTAGVKGPECLGAWGLPVGKGGRVEVTPALHLADHPEVWVVGDMALVTDDMGVPLPQVAPAAIQEGEHAAASIARALRGEPAQPFRYRDKGMLVVIGRNAAAASLWGRVFTGLPAWLLWLGIHIAQLIGFRNRALVLVNWAWNYISFERAVRLILPSGGDPGPPARPPDLRTPPAPRSPSARRRSAEG